MSVATSELVAVQRSAAMAQRRQTCPVDRDTLVDICAELLEARQLLARLGTDLKAVAAKSPRS